MYEDDSAMALSWICCHLGGYMFTCYMLRLHVWEIETLGGHNKF